VIPTSSNKGGDHRHLDLAGSNRLPVSFRWGFQTIRRRGHGQFLRSGWFRAMASVLLRSLGSWQRRRAFLSAESFLWSRGALRVAGGTRRYALGRAPPSGCISGVPACGDSADRLPSPTLSPRMMPLNRTWVCPSLWKNHRNARSIHGSRPGPRPPFFELARSLQNANGIPGS
jgi:hypothetical protein